MNVKSVPRATRLEKSLLSTVSVETDNACEMSLTRVSLASIEGRLDVYLRFGVPVQTRHLDGWRRVAMFAPGAVFARVSWRANQHGRPRWQVMVMQSVQSRDTMQRIPGVHPGAQLLLHAEGEDRVRAVLLAIDAVEAQGIAPATVSPMYWSTLGNRVAACLPLPAYTAERHTAWLAGEGKC